MCVCVRACVHVRVCVHLYIRMYVNVCTSVFTSYTQCRVNVCLFHMHISHTFFILSVAFLSFTVNSANVKEGVDTSITLTVMSSNTFQDDQVVGISAMDGEAESEWRSGIGLRDVDCTLPARGI